MKSPEQLFAFIKKQKVAFIASVDEGGFPNLKAMLPPRKIEAPRLFYFSTNTSSLRVAQYRNNPRAGIYFYHKGLFSYEGLMLLGEMEVREEPCPKRGAVGANGQALLPQRGVRSGLLHPCIYGPGRALLPRSKNRKLSFVKQPP